MHVAAASARDALIRSAPVILAMLAALTAGCGGGPTIVPVSGTVTINGKPLTGRSGFVRVVPAGFRAATGSINPDDGTFVLTTLKPNDGCVTGTHPAAVIVNIMVGSRLVWLVPERYGDDATSGLTVEITGSTSTLNLDLKGPLKAPPKPTAEDLRLQEAG